MVRRRGSPNCSSAVDGTQASVGGARNGRPEDRRGRTCAAEEDWVGERWRREPYCPSSAPMEIRERRGVETWGPDSSSNHADSELPYFFLRREYRSICQPQISDDAAWISSKVSVVYLHDTPIQVSPCSSVKCVWRRGDSRRFDDVVRIVYVVDIFTPEIQLTTASTVLSSTDTVSGSSRLRYGLPVTCTTGRVMGRIRRGRCGKARAWRGPRCDGKGKRWHRTSVACVRDAPANWGENALRRWRTSGLPTQTVTAYPYKLGRTGRVRQAQLLPFQSNPIRVGNKVVASTEAFLALTFNRPTGKRYASKTGPKN